MNSEQDISEDQQTNLLSLKPIRIAHVFLNDDHLGSENASTGLMSKQKAWDNPYHNDKEQAALTLE
jgi:hypothetical protein